MSSMEPGISFRELFHYSDYLAGRWIKYFNEHPDALDVEVGGRTGSLRNLVSHIFDVELFFAAQVSGENPARPAQAKQETPTLEELLQRHQKAQEKLLRFVESANEEGLRQKHTFGPVTVSSRKLLAQTALHSIHHWAQVAMEVRQAGFPVEKPQDIIITDLME
ncbi:MAG TPA: DinB family protein [Candidatus Angelobacter sp.]